MNSFKEIALVAGLIAGLSFVPTTVHAQKLSNADLSLIKSVHTVYQHWIDALDKKIGAAIDGKVMLSRPGDYEADYNSIANAIGNNCYLYGGLDENPAYKERALGCSMRVAWSEGKIRIPLKAPANDPNTAEQYARYEQLTDDFCDSANSSSKIAQIACERYSNMKNGITDMNAPNGKIKIARTKQSGKFAACKAEMKTDNPLINIAVDMMCAEMLIEGIAESTESNSQ